MEVTEKHICCETQTKGTNSTSPSLCCCSVAQLCPTLCDPMDCSMPGFPVLHHLRGLAQIISIESVMPSNPPVLCHPLLLISVFPSIRVFSSQFFTSGVQSIGTSASASVLLVNIQDSSPLGLTGLISLQSKGFSRSPTPQFKSMNSSVLSFLYGPTLTSILVHILPSSPVFT